MHDVERQLPVVDVRDIHTKGLIVTACYLRREHCRITKHHYTPFPEPEGDALGAPGGGTVLSRRRNVIDGSSCAKCLLYFGDGQCAIIEGEVSPDGWCNQWVPPTVG